ncbi:hypothetical protein TWF970_006495 [Orbilia oligospora]|uniref:Uncharacterized protein n=1 Tax=Orbilia oligospora TaxID=2813651 RepID=A0A7C8VK73_ORBOL|nr:hypothetical protein TWF970_006495 [Orbilia oligospora]
MPMGGILNFLLMASALAYEMTFLEELDPEIGEFGPEGAIWNRYNNGIGCTEIPPNPSGYVEEIILRVPVMNDLADRTGFLHEGDVALQDREPDAGQEWVVIKDNIDFSPVPYIEAGNQDPLCDSRSPSMESEYIEEPGAPLRLGSSMSDEIEIEIERAPGGNSSASFRSDETDPFEEMYFFERNQPNFWISLVQQLGEVRDAAMAAGLYIPIPLGLRSRYSDEDLNALGVTIDPEAEEEILRDLVGPTRQSPGIANVMIRPIYQIFTGSYPGIWNYLLESSGWAAENESQNVEMSEIDLLAPGRGPQRSVSQSVGENSDIVSNGQLVRPSNSLSNDLTDRRAIASEHSMEFEEEATSPSFRWEGSNLDANAECLIHDICIGDTP